MTKTKREETTFLNWEKYGVKLMYEAIEQFGMILWQLRIWLVLIFGLAIAGGIRRMLTRR